MKWQFTVEVCLQSPLTKETNAALPKIPNFQEWDQRFANISIPPLDQIVWNQAKEDIRALLMRTPHGLYPAAGVPWFVAAFGRDALWTIHMIMPWAKDVASGVLRYLAIKQGREESELTEESHGKILHEVRQGELSRTGKIPFECYYGTVDSTPLFVAMMEDYWETHQDDRLLLEFRPHIEAALKWIKQFQDEDHRMLVFNPSGSGLAIQSWKDSADPMCHSNGELAQAPLAVSEVQGYAYRAFCAAAKFYQIWGETEMSQYWADYAESFKETFHKLFWNDNLKTYALALDFHGQQLEVYSSDPGQLLWSGIVPEAFAETLVDTLFSEDNWSGWGLRTLGLREVRYNPLSYHNGSVWPHDTAIFAGGLARYGFQERFQQVSEALFSLAKTQRDYRLPELVGGYARDSGIPVTYPDACRPQAWSAASLIYLKRFE